MVQQASLTRIVVCKNYWAQGLAEKVRSKFV